MSDVIDLVLRAPDAEAAEGARAAVAAGSLWGVSVSGAVASVVQGPPGRVPFYHFVVVEGVPSGSRDALEQSWPGGTSGWVVVGFGEDTAAAFRTAPARKA